MERSKMKKLIIILGIALIGIIGSGAAVSYTSQPSFCTSCHEVAPAVESWEVSAHQQVDCMACHADPGFTGKMKIKLNSWKEIKAHLFDNLSPEEVGAHVEVPADRCLSCHVTEGEPTNKYAKGLDVGSLPDFAMHENATELDCISCHGRDIVHDYDKSEVDYSEYK